VSFTTTIHMLLARRDEPLSPEQWKRIKARGDWALGMVEQLREAVCRRDALCSAAADRLGEEEFNRLFAAEEARVAALRARIDAAIERDHWPRELYWGEI
jgi:hypothetical protein